MSASYLRIAHNQRELNAGGVVPIQLAVKDTVGNPVVSGLSLQVYGHIHNPDWTIVGSGLQFTNQGSDGVYSLDFDSPNDAVAGWYTVVSFWSYLSQTNRVVQRLFRLNDTLI
jgi:hypothetical protein